MSTLTPIDRLDLAQQMQVFCALSIAVSGILLWELLVCFPDELRFIYWPELVGLLRHGRLPPLPSVFLLAARILAIPLTMTHTMVDYSLLSMQIDQAHKAMAGCIYLFAVCGLNATAIFVARTIAVRQSRLAMKTFLSICLLAFGALYFYAAIFTRYPPAHISSKEQIRPFIGVNLFISMMVSTMTFDVVIFLLTVGPEMDGFKWRRKYDAKVKCFFRDAVVYFGIRIVVNVINFAWFVAHSNHRFDANNVVPIYVWLNLVIAPRTIRNLKLDPAKRCHTVSSVSMMERRCNDVERDVTFIVNAVMASRSLSSPRSPSTVPLGADMISLHQKGGRESDFCDKSSLDEETFSTNRTPASC